jgi:hypothetical protein
MKFDYHKHESRIKTQEYWKNRQPFKVEDFRKKEEEYFIITHHPNGMTTRVIRKSKEKESK